MLVHYSVPFMMLFTAVFQLITLIAIGIYRLIEEDDPDNSSLLMLGFMIEFILGLLTAIAVDKGGFNHGYGMDYYSIIQFVLLLTGMNFFTVYFYKYEIAKERNGWYGVLLTLVVLVPMLFGSLFIKYWMVWS